MWVEACFLITCFTRKGDYLIWEGSQQNLYFADSGVTVQTHIDADAQSRAFTDWAGWAQRTSDWKTYNCYKVTYYDLANLRNMLV